MSLAISLNSNRITSYHSNERCAARQHYVLGYVHKTPKKKRSYEMSPQSQKNIKNCINWLLTCSAKRKIFRSNGSAINNFQVSFVTLTLPAKQKHSHSEIKSKCLNLFLTVMRNKYNLENYVWKAELQANGSIHFHLTFDKYFHHMQIRKLWNNCIEKLGYVTAYQNRFYDMSYEQYAAYRSQAKSFDAQRMKKSYDYGVRSKWRSPNSTDVKSVKSVEKLAAYLSKYMAKPLSNNNSSSIVQKSAKSFTGRLWFCSTSLSRLGNIQLPYSVQNMRILNMVSKIKSTFIAYRDYSKSLYFRISDLPKELVTWLEQELFSHAINRLYPFPSCIPSLSF